MTSPSNRPHTDPQPIGKALRLVVGADRTLEALTQMGGKRWSKAGRDRVYFTTEQLYDTVGGSLSRYKTGNVMSAWLPDFPGGRIANGWAEIDGFYDLIEERWNLTGDPRLVDHLTRLLNVAVSSAVAELEAAEREAEEAAAAARAADESRPLPSKTAVLDRCTPEQLRELAGAALEIIGILGHRTEWDPVADVEEISAKLKPARPAFLPPFDPNTHADARWYCDLIGVDYADDILPVEEICPDCHEPSPGSELCPACAAGLEASDV